MSAIDFNPTTRHQPPISSASTQRPVDVVLVLVHVAIATRIFCLGNPRQCFGFAARENQQEQHIRVPEIGLPVRPSSPAQCFGIEHDNGLMYRVVEYIAGQDLGALPRRQPLSVDRFLELIGQAAEGLAAVQAIA